MKLTELQAIKMSLDMWKWLNKNPLKEKENYPKFSLIGNMMGECPCCEYYQRNFGMLKCPLNKVKSVYCGLGCAEYHFSAWAEAEFCGNIEASQIHSAWIVDKLQERYDELRKTKS